MSVQQGVSGEPARGEVFLYKDANFSGNSWKVTGNVFDFRSVSGLNDVVSSVKVGPNTKAFIFKDDRFNGDFIRLEQNTQVTDLTTRNLNDAISSIIVATFDSA
uniref:Spherulin 3b n=1 Tax=Physarum polycephalum TaxID=5791 RepID=Q4U3C9_PHYPO|nr:spherulin 3b [Physarum polycephalum]|eukprot:Phypoly_transcript_25305.p1 GENE.Phypoly_transcript_25305~~Phypoly_transcript_25305.p1  ORF type:complete len:104 (-),score=16.97 Phypoly_transcript_25305:36-347(-)